MKCDAAFKRRIELECCSALEKAGFTRFRKDKVDYPIHNRFHCWVGLALGLDPDRVTLYPNVGLHVVPIHKMISTIEIGPDAQKYNRGVATCSLSLATLPEITEDMRAFAFSPLQSDAFIASECERLAFLYLTVGLKYARSIASYEALAPILKAQVKFLGGYPERYAVCLYQMGKKAEAIDFLKSFPEEKKKIIQGFADPFIAKIEAELRDDVA